MRSYYAASYPYGANAIGADTGRTIRNVLSFRSRAERDAWVDARSTDYRTNSGYRDAVAAATLSTRERERIASEPYFGADGLPIYANA